MTYALNFTEQDWERIEFDWTAWWEGELDRPIVVVENPVHARLPEELSREFLLERPVEESAGILSNPPGIQPDIW